MEDSSVLYCFEFLVYTVVNCVVLLWRSCYNCARLCCIRLYSVVAVFSC